MNLPSTTNAKPLPVKIRRALASIERHQLAVKHLMRMVENHYGIDGVVDDDNGDWSSYVDRQGAVCRVADSERMLREFCERKLSLPHSRNCGAARRGLT